MRPVRARRPVRAPLSPAPLSSTPPARSRDGPLTRPSCVTVSYAMRTAPSPRSMRRVRAREPARVRLASQSAKVGRSQDSTLTEPMRSTASCGIRRASSPHSIFRARARARARVRFGGGFTPDGTIMGVYADADSLYHGFLLDTNGAVTTFDAPDAGNVPGSFQGTVPWGINTNGEITGYYTDETNVNHGFVRDKHGTIAEFDVPAAANMGPWASIAPNGAVVSFFFDQNAVVHGFVREADRGSGIARPELTVRQIPARPTRP